MLQDVLQVQRIGKILPCRTLPKPELVSKDVKISQLTLLSKLRIFY
jgi:hypothetical protein